MTLSGVLPDVNVLLALGWRSHPDHQQCRAWFAKLPSFATCPITELGFLRVSMSPAYRSSYADASRVLQSLTTRAGGSFIHCDMPTALMSSVSRYKDTTDCYLVELARRHSFRLATLDDGILTASWAKESAFHPLRS